ncbi:MAG TPA: hypothetical protein PK299_07960 [Anaerolineales bacterium]|nr:hypothetical protein [Anaerolineales bacterium]
MFEFDTDDLKSNRLGQISVRQREWLKGIAQGARKTSWSNTFIAIGFAILGLCVILALYLQNESTRKALFSNAMNGVVLIGGIFAILGILALGIVLAYWNSRRLQNATLLSVTGKVRFDESYSSNSNLRSYYVIVGTKRFAFGNDIRRNFSEGAKYRFYYCKPGMYEFVLSYEKVE